MFVVGREEYAIQEINREKRKKVFRLVLVSRSGEFELTSNGTSGESDGVRVGEEGGRVGFDFGKGESFGGVG